MALQIGSPFQQFFDRSGSPLDNGFVYVGAVNLNPETNPLTIYYDDALTIPAAQPLRTLNGYIMRNGSPARLYTSQEDFSLTVREKSGALVFAVADANSLSDLASDLASGSGSSMIGYNQGGASAVDRTVQSRLRDFVSVKDFGAVGDGVTDDTAAFNAAFASSQNVFIPAGTYMVSSITVSSPDGLRSVFGVGRDSIIKCSSSGQTVLTVDRANYSGFRDFRILVDAANVTAILITDSAGSTIDDVTTFSTFSNVDVESTGVHLGSTALRIARAIGIRFFGCDFLRTEVGINFSGEAPPNAINFYGCLLRGNGNAYASAGSTNNRGLIIDGNSTSIGFHGCVQEFWSTPSLLNSGNVSFDGNCHFEGSVSGVHIIQEGGNLSVLDSWIDAQRFFINDGVSSVFKHNRVRRATSPVNTFTDDQPAIQLRADVSTRIVVEDNIPVTGNEVVYRPYEYRDPADNLWKPRSKPYWEVANVVPCAFLARLSADISNVTGDGTAYDVVFGTSGVDFDLNGNFDGTDFIAPQNGLYEFSVAIAIKTTVAGNRFITRLLSTSKDYLLIDRVTVSTDPTTINANARVYMKKGETAKINIDVSGASKTTDVLYGTPSTSWTYFSGKLVSGA